MPSDERPRTCWCPECVPPEEVRHDYTREFFHANEVKLIVGMRSMAERFAYINGDAFENGVRQYRGDAVADRLLVDVTAELKRRSEP